MCTEILQDLCNLTTSDVLALIENAPNINWDCLQDSDLAHPIVSYYVLHGYVETNLQPNMDAAYQYYKQLCRKRFPSEFVNSRVWDSEAQTFVGTCLPYNSDLDKGFETRFYLEKANCN